MFNSPISRRTTLASLGGLGLLSLVHAPSLAATPSQKFVQQNIMTYTKDCHVVLNLTPDRDPIAKSWYQRLNVQVSGGSYLSALVYYVRPGVLGFQLEKYMNGKIEVLSTTTVQYPTSHATMICDVTTKESSLIARLKDAQGVDLARLEHHQPKQTSSLGAWGVTHSAYVSAPHPIEFNEWFSGEEVSFKDERWSLVFEDHFDGTSIDTSLWRVRDSQAWLDRQPNSWPSTNKNSRAVDCSSNIEVSYGSAKIWLRPLTEQRTIWGQTIDHTSGYLDSIGTCEVQYGRWEIRCKQPVGPERALWGGFWLMNGGSTTTRMTDYFEIDVNEGYGKNENGRSWSRDKSPFPSHNRAESSVHFDATGKNKVNRFAPQGTDDFENEWHTWAVEVTPENGIQFFLDDVNYFTVPPSNPHLAARLTQQFALNMRLNLMTGWYWNTTSTDVEREKPLEIDYVRVWSYAV